jgi:hypothetical protein
MVDSFFAAAIVTGFDWDVAPVAASARSSICRRHGMAARAMLETGAGDGFSDHAGCPRATAGGGKVLEKASASDDVRRIAAFDRSR